MYYGYDISDDEDYVETEEEIVESEINSSVISRFDNYLKLENTESHLVDKYHVNIISCIQDRNIKQLEILLKEIRRDLKKSKGDIIFPNGYNPMIYAAQLASPELIRFFIENDGDSNLRVYRSGLTPLLAVCGCRHTDQSITFEQHQSNVLTCAEILIDDGADMQSKLTSSNNSVLHLAASNNYSRLVDLFVVTWLVDVDSMNENNCNPLMIAAALGHVDTAYALKKLGSDLTLKNEEGLTASDLALISGYWELAESLKNGQKLSRFFKAWSLVHRYLKTGSKKKATNLTYDPARHVPSFMRHLEPVLFQNNIIFNDLRSMSDSELKTVGIRRHEDRKKILNLMQGSHKLRWNSDRCLIDIDFSQQLQPMEIYDLVLNMKEQLDFITMSVKYMRHHLEVNEEYYSTISKTENGSKTVNSIIDQYEEILTLAKRMKDCFQKLDITFEKISYDAIQDDEGMHLDENDELQKLKGIMEKKSAVSVLKVIGGVTLVCGIVVGAVFIRNRV